MYDRYSSKLRGMHRSAVPNWCIPFAYSLGAFILALTVPRIEARFLPELTFSISVSSATAIYSSIASGMIALTGIVFSLVFVMVQFGATAYSPRLVLWMSRDPFLFHALGVFTATFLYSIAALAWVDRFNSGKVPALSVWFVVGLLLASVGVFVSLVHRLNRLQINKVLSFTGDFGRQVIDLIYPPLEEPGTVVEAADFAELPLTQRLVYNGPPRTDDFLSRDTLVESTLVLQVYGGREEISERALKNAIKTGTERTFQQDPKYSIRLLVDIAIRALSPAVNDPMTAVQALDHIEDLLLRLGRRRLEVGKICSSDGRLRVVIAIPRWQDFLGLALTEIRYYGAQSVQVMRRMRAC